MGQFFDHYLKGAPAAPWMVSGERFIDKDKRPPLPITVEKKLTRATPATNNVIRP
jgi:hypothetical protein